LPTMPQMCILTWRKRLTKLAWKQGSHEKLVWLDWIKCEDAHACGREGSGHESKTLNGIGLCQIGSGLDWVIARSIFTPQTKHQIGLDCEYVNKCTTVKIKGRINLRVLKNARKIYLPHIRMCSLRWRDVTKRHLLIWVWLFLVVWLL
jgi:hypothetical protein